MMEPDVALDRHERPATAGDRGRGAGTLALRFPSYDLFGTKITPTSERDLIDILETAVADDEQAIIASQNLHGMRVLYEVDAVRRLHELAETFVHIDGMPVVALCKLVGIAAKREHRVTLIDLIWPVLRTAQERGWRVFYIGATPDVLSAGLAKIRHEFPTLDIVGRQGFFDLDDAAVNAEIVTSIHAFAPQLILVGMGMARQETWILNNYADLAPASIITLGACMEYVAGSVKTPPRWMGRAGLEWLFRFAENPSRFWHRYLIEPWVLLAHIIMRAANKK